MKTSFLYLFSILLAWHHVPCAWGQTSPASDIKNVQANVQRILNKDNGALWGIELNTPVVFIDQERNVWATAQDKDGLLKEDDGLFRGKYPIEKNIANSTTTFAGQRWTMVMLPMRGSLEAKTRLVVHEMIHYWQDSLQHSSGFVFTNPHIDELSGRVLLQQEWNALMAAAMHKEKKQRKQALADALAYRNQRRLLFPEGIKDENAFEVSEGLPEYTAFTLCADDEQGYRQLLVDTQKTYMKKESLTRSFAYFSGPLYGYLLDQSGKQWRKQIHASSDLGALLADAYGIREEARKASRYEEIRAKHGYDSIYPFEYARAQKIEELRQHYHQTFNESCILVLPLSKCNVSFDPGKTFAWKGEGTVYSGMRLVDEWGILECNTEDCLMRDDWRSALVAGSEIKCPCDEEAKLIEWGDYKLTLNEGYKLDKTAPMKWTIIKSE